MLLIVTQVWVGMVALVLFLVTQFGTMTPNLLLLLTVGNGIGMAGPCAGLGSHSGDASSTWVTLSARSVRLSGGAPPRAAGPAAAFPIYSSSVSTGSLAAAATAAFLAYQCCL